MRRTVGSAVAVGLAVGVVLGGANPASAKPRPDWCAVAEQAASQAETLDVELTQLHEAAQYVTATDADVLRAQTNSVQDQKRLVDEKAALTQGECERQVAEKLTRCPPQHFSEAQQRALDAQRRQRDEEMQAQAMTSAPAPPVYVFPVVRSYSCTPRRP